MGELRPARPTAIILLVQAAVLIGLAGRYGYHRDELYFLACGRRPAWGYPDQPPLTPMLARLGDWLAPHSLTAFRLPAVLIALWATLLAAAIAGELGGGRFAQGLAALAVGSGTLTLVSGHLLATSTADLGVWVTVTWLITVILRTGRQGLWLAVGAVLGIGLLNKQLPVFLMFALLVGMLLTSTARPALRTPWPYLGGLVAAVGWAPVLLWQARHAWPQLTLAGQIHDEYGQLGARIGAAALQVVLFSIGATALWALGLWWLFRDPRWRRYRPLAWAWPVLMMVFAVTAGQGYYPGGLYPALIAAGAVVVERARPRRRAAMVTAVAVSATLLVPSALPVLPASVLDGSPWAAVAEQQREMVGWPALVDQVAEAYRSIPQPQRAATVVFTANYGEAGAVEELGPARGLPALAYSGHNGFGLWGPPPAGAAPVVVVWQGPAPSAQFTGCRARGRVVTGVHNEESDEASVWVCDQPVGGWTAAWPRLMHLSA